MDLEAIKEAIAALAAEERALLAAWLLQRQDREEWDAQIYEDFQVGGDGFKLLREAQADAQAGRAKPMNEFLAKARRRRPEPEWES